MPNTDSEGFHAQGNCRASGETIVAALPRQLREAER
jgi:hypothetical protein